MSPFTRINSSRSPLLYAAIAALLLTLIVGAGMAIAKHETVAVDNLSPNTSRTVVDHMDSSAAWTVAFATVDLDGSG